MSHDQPGGQRRMALPGVLEMWPSLAITMMWVAVTVDAIWGPSIVATSAAGDRASFPSAIIVALFAWLGTWSVARHVLQHPRRD